MAKLFKIQPRTDYSLGGESGLVLASGLSYDGAVKKARDTEAKYALEDKLAAEYAAECAAVDGKVA